MNLHRRGTIGKIWKPELTENPLPRPHPRHSTESMKMDFRGLKLILIIFKNPS